MGEGSAGGREGECWRAGVGGGGGRREELVELPSNLHCGTVTPHLGGGWGGCNYHPATLTRYLGA